MCIKSKKNIIRKRTESSNKYLLQLMTTADVLYFCGFMVRFPKCRALMRCFMGPTYNTQHVHHFIKSCLIQAGQKEANTNNLMLCFLPPSPLSFDNITPTQMLIHMHTKDMLKANRLTS